MQIHQQTLRMTLQTHLTGLHTLVVRVETVVLVPVYLTHERTLLQTVQHGALKALQALSFLLVELVTEMHLDWNRVAS